MLCHAWATHPQVHRLDIIINNHSPHDLFRLPNATPHVQIHSLDAKPFGVAEWWQMQKLLRRLSPDWVYAPYFLLPPSHRPTKRMLTIHDAIPLEHTSKSWIQQQVIKQIVRSSMARVDCVTTVSAHAALQIQHHYGYRGPIQVIHNGVADAFFDRPPTYQLAKYGISQPFGLCVSSNQPHKNLPGLLEAWALAYRTGLIPSDSQLVIAGHTDTRRATPWCEQQYADIPIVHLSDPADELLNQLYHSAHLFVLPSLAEGFGLPVIEALAAQNVVLCHDYPTLRQLHGEVVYYTDMQKPQQVAHELGELWHNHTLRRKAIQRAQAHAYTFRWKSIANQYIAHMHHAPTSRCTDVGA